MAKYCKNEKDLKDAINDKEDEIYIEGDVKNWVIKIKATGSVAWAVCIGCIAIAIAIIIASGPAAAVKPEAGAAALVSGTVIIGAAAKQILGSALIPVITFGVMTGGIGALTTLREKYKIVEKTDKYIKLERKK